jgi:hypothetical protein
MIVHKLINECLSFPRKIITKLVDLFCCSSAKRVELCSEETLKLFVEFGGVWRGKASPERAA